MKRQKFNKKRTHVGIEQNLLMKEQRSSLISLEQFRNKALKVENKLPPQSSKHKEDSKRHTTPREPLKDIASKQCPAPPTTELILNPKLHKPKSLNVDDYFVKKHGRIQSQFSLKTPLFSVEEMLDLPAIEKMLCPKAKTPPLNRSSTVKESTGSNLGSTTLAEMLEESDIRKLETMAPKTRSELSEIEQILNFAHLYLESIGSTEAESYLARGSFCHKSVNEQF